MGVRFPLPAPSKLFNLHTRFTRGFCASLSATVSRDSFRDLFLFLLLGSCSLRVASSRRFLDFSDQLPIGTQTSILVPSIGRE